MRRRSPSSAAPTGRPLRQTLAAVVALLGLLLSASGASAVIVACPCGPEANLSQAAPADDASAARPACHDEAPAEPAPAPAAPAVPDDCDCALTCCNWIAMPADPPEGAAVLKPAPDRHAAPSLPPVDFVIDPAYPPPRA